MSVVTDYKWPAWAEVDASRYSINDEMGTLYKLRWGNYNMALSVSDRLLGDRGVAIYAKIEPMVARAFRRADLRDALKEANEMYSCGWSDEVLQYIEAAVARSASEDETMRQLAKMNHVMKLDLPPTELRHILDAVRDYRNRTQELPA